MPKEIKVMSDVVTESNGTVRSDMLDNETTRPKFLSRKRSDEYGEIGSTQTSRKNRKLFWWGLGVIVAILVLFFVLGSFAKATILVTPRSQEVSLNDEVTLYRSNGGALSPSFKTMEVRDEVSRELQSTGTKDIERKASGIIIVFNEYSPSALKLIKNTRFQAPNGKIFRTPVATTVPGTRTEAGKTVPGSVEVEVFADQAGSSYNVGLVDFTVPGLQGDPSYSKVYARSKTPIEGGYTGKVPVVSDSDKEKAEIELEAELGKKLSAKLSTETPSGYVLIPDVVSINMGDLEAAYDQVGADSTSNLAVFKKKGSLTGVIISETDLAKAIAKLKVSGYNDEGIYLSSNESVTFVAKDPKFDLVKSPTLVLTLGGNATLIWEYNPDILREALLGQKRSDYKEIFRQFPMVKNAEINIFPVWKGKFPDNPNKIKIETAN